MHNGVDYFYSDPNWPLGWLQPLCECVKSDIFLDILKLPKVKGAPVYIIYELIFILSRYTSVASRLCGCCHTKGTSF
jgi:hypothetical protein